MTKRKPVDIKMWMRGDKRGAYWRPCNLTWTRAGAEQCALTGETVIRVRVTEVPKKKRKGKR